MGQGSGAGAGGTSIASIGFQVAGDLARGRAEEAGQQFLAQRAREKAEVAKLQASQTGAQYDEQLAVTLGNIDAIRAAAFVDPSSPTGFAIKDNETRVSNRAKSNAVTSLKLQAAMDESEALYRDRVGRDAIRMSYINAGTTITKGLASIGR